MEDFNLIDAEGVLIKGPAKVIVSRGEVDVFGKTFGRGDDFTVIHGKTFPVQAVSNSKLAISSRSPSSKIKVRGRLIPEMWNYLAEELIMGEKRVIIIIGDVDTGKSSLVLYLANRLCSKGYTTAVVDADIGQSDIGPPGVIGLCVVESQTTSLASLPLNTGYFIGDNNPSSHTLSISVGTGMMVKEALNLDVKAVLVDTTGMIYGETARILKEKKMEMVSPHIVAVLQRSSEIEHLVTPIERRYRIYRLPVPTHVKRTSREERIALRGLSMHRYVRGSSTLTLDMNRVKLTLSSKSIRGDDLDNCVFSKTLNSDVLHLKGSQNMAILIIDYRYDREEVDRLQEIHDKGVRVIRAKSLRRLMLGLLDKRDRLLDIGFLERIDLNKKRLFISTSLRSGDEVRYVKLGRLIIDEHGHEVGRAIFKNGSLK